jgi:hypothetical protein
MEKVVIGAEEKYFEEKFSNMNGKLDAIVTAISKHDDKIDTIEKDVGNLKFEQKAHFDWHDKKSDNKRFNIQQFVSLLAIIVTIILAVKYM